MIARLRAYLVGLSPDALVVIGSAVIILFLTSGVAG
jgi:hypothetical protein